MTENRAVAINTESCFRDIVQETVVESKASEPLPQSLHKCAQHNAVRKSDTSEELMTFNLLTQ